MSFNSQILQDSFGRGHDYLRISLIERCNLRCFYCMPEDGIALRPRSHFMRNEEVLEIAKVFVDLGVKKIRLTGGEPLIRKDVDSIILELSKLPVELAITTNAVRAHEFVGVFKQAGMKSINVSLDTLQSVRFEKITRRDEFNQVMSNIELLIREGFSVKVNAVLMKGENDDEIIDFIEWTKTAPIDVRFIEFMPFDGNQWQWDKKISFNKILDVISVKYGETAIHKLPALPNDTARNFKLNGAKGSFGIISTVTNPFCDSCNRIRLTADGKIKNCLFSNDESDLLSALRAGQPIKPLIESAIKRKKFAKSGIEDFSDYKGHDNRAMISIGG
ncbi:MAG: GTP 3',8-cyclase MoaA [Crocinitomicaceae bacterium]|nr:GTP 3',8-cyclase MoaA [Crocinitomicaceae bacterium]